MIHDWAVLIMWVTSLLVTAWGQNWKAKADRLADAVEYLVEEQVDAGSEEAVQEDADQSDRV